MARRKIVVVGSVNSDMVVKGYRLPGLGETVTGGQFINVWRVLKDTHGDLLTPAD